MDIPPEAGGLLAPWEAVAAVAMVAMDPIGDKEQLQNGDSRRDLRVDF
jgi:hypothetical protein